MNHGKNRLSFILAIFLSSLVGLAAYGCTETPTHESTGQYVDDSAITAKVKTQLLHDSLTQGLNIDVETYKGIVELSGFVNTASEKEHAQVVAEDVEGVKGVRNALVVKTAQQ